MNARLLATPLVATTLLLSTLGCAKKDDATPASTSNTGSYKLNGRTVNCQARTYFKSYASNSGGPGTDVLSVILTTNPQPAAGKEEFAINFEKASTQPTTAYRPTTIHLVDSDYPQGLPMRNDLTTLSTTSSSVSGTFAATGTNTPGTSITAGVFTDVSL